ncbi:uncharacterized protein LOC112519383 [Cynara cardunculus var. scolymus]|uniref:uncharacterized protein LOC112519383 n=1 Tax=Cynara cardunculus var. scolymus TaxID=59895 RepID=UPI000D62BEEB|nr:uncharacterized protein LOC112519383 [Cynara cardunculus var. scolymus]
MPSGPKRRKAAKKKQVKESNNSNSSSTTHSHHGESDGGELCSPAAQDQHNHQVPFTEGEVVAVEKNEAGLYQNQSVTVESTEKAGKEEEGSTEIDKGSKLSKSQNSSSSSISSSVDDESHVSEKKVVELESAPVAESVHSIESFPKKIAHEVKDSGVETSSVLHPVKPVDSLLEAESHANDCTQIEKLVPKSLFSEQMLVVNGSALKDNCSTSSEVGESAVVENGTAKSPSPEENASLEARDDDVAVSTHPMGSISEPETSQYSDKQPLVASAPRAAQTTSWKGCCGILELFSSSDRN